ncbi:PadR family transcriptional regulator [Glutamicibacter sp. JC586]|uniref:PadR family transcriptional regulator n=1 Tax=Glutamicibacter sp. JC586 TaxID=2590552 RepID=UPI001359EB50|nr:PadR family transcriptional regulator [Glutamicibacter sp. JC586]
MFEQREKIATNIRKGVLEYCVLGSLSSGDKYGLELAEQLTELNLTAGEGSLYPLLARMKAAGLVETQWHEGGTGRKRKYYSITAHGHQMLNEFRAVWTEIAGQVEQILGGQNGEGS